MNPHADPRADPANEWKEPLRRHTLTLPWAKPKRRLWLTMNEYRRGHYGRQTAATRNVRVLVTCALQDAPCAPMQRATVTITQHVPDLVRRDTDGLGALGKDINDALVACGIFPDDSWKHIPDVTYRTRGPVTNPRITIELEETE